MTRLSIWSQPAPCRDATPDAIAASPGNAFRRNSERYRTMAGVLAQVRTDMSEATELKEVQEVARETERVMREENSDWFGVMRFHDIELIT
jgi:hypothetical protein